MDALRLLLSLLILVTHARRIFDVRFPVWLTKGVFDGKAAVVMFFVMSGYVLTKSLAKRPISVAAWRHYVIRRVFRLFPAYWVALVITFLALWAIKMNAPFVAPGASILFLTQDGFGLGQWLLHFTLVIPGMDSQFALPPVWSLMTESKISLLAFPFLGWLILRLPLWQARLLTTLLVLGSDFMFDNVLGTTAYLGMFAIGATMARVPTKVWAAVPQAGWTCMLLAGMGMYSCMSIRFVLPNVWMGYYLCAVGSGLLIACISNWDRLRRPMHSLFSWVGIDVSYGVYLLHYPVLLSVANFGGAFVEEHSIVAACTAMGCTVVLAWLLAHTVEVPMIRMGRQMTQEKKAALSGASQVRGVLS